MSRYRTDDHNDLIDRIKGLEKRLSILERTPQTFRAGINSGVVSFQGGSILFLESADDVPPTGVDHLGQLAIGPPTPDDGTLRFSMTRAHTVPSDEFYEGTPDPVNGADIFRFRTREGTGGSKSSTWELYDKTGDAVISDSRNARRGLDHPRLSYPWNVGTFSTTTSATFSEICNTEWYMYHPHLRVRILVNNDVGTASEILAIDQSTGVNSSILTHPVASGALGYQDVIIARSATADGHSPNGNSSLIRIDHRRSSGAGTARSRIVSIIGIDLSLFEPY